MTPSDAKLKSSRISFNMASAFKDGGGRLSVDDALIIAATTAVIVDFEKSPDGDLKRVMREMKRFLKYNSRFRTFTKQAISEGLRTEWLPTLEDDEKIVFLSDIRLIANVTEDGFAEANLEMLAKLTASEHPDTERYGTEPYSPKPTRKSSSASRPKEILTSVEKDLNLATKLKPYIEWYKKHWEDLQRLEDYKWTALKKFRDHFDINAKDFSAMWNSAFDSDFNLLATGSFYNPLGGVKKLAKYAPEKTREMFLALFDDEKNLARRVDAFLQSFGEVYDQLVVEDKIKSGMYDRQSERSISVYLAFYNPSVYYIFKPSLWWDFVNQTGVSYPSLNYFESKLTGYNMICDQIREVLMQDGELLTLLNKSQADDPSDGHLLTQDFLYCIGIHFIDFNSAPRNS